MKKINFKGISEILSEKELKNVMGGSNECFSNAYQCYCTDNYTYDPEKQPVFICADSLYQALNGASSGCFGSGVTCF